MPSRYAARTRSIDRRRPDADELRSPRLAQRTRRSSVRQQRGKSGVRPQLLPCNFSSSHGRESRGRAGGPRPAGRSGRRSSAWSVMWACPTRPSCRQQQPTATQKEDPLAQPAILVENLTKSFGSVQALRGIDLDAQEGAVLGLLGPNGAGKTTAIRILATLLKPDSGRALVAGHDVVQQGEWVRRGLGLTGP